MSGTKRKISFRGTVHPSLDVPSQVQRNRSEPKETQRNDGVAHCQNAHYLLEMLDRHTATCQKFIREISWIMSGVGLLTPVCNRAPRCVMPCEEMSVDLARMMTNPTQEWSCTLPSLVLATDYGWMLSVEDDIYVWVHRHSPKEGEQPEGSASWQNPSVLWSSWRITSSTGKCGHSWVSQHKPQERPVRSPDKHIEIGHSETTRPLDEHPLGSKPTSPSWISPPTSGGSGSGGWG